jgi:hypothetical protein
MTYSTGDFCLFLSISLEKIKAGKIFAFDDNTAAGDGREEAKGVCGDELITN